MTSQRLLVAVFTVSCIVLSTGNHVNATTLTYPGRVWNTIQGECPSDVQREAVISEVTEDIRNLLHQLGKWVHIYIAMASRPICKEMWSINCSCMLLIADFHKLGRHVCLEKCMPSLEICRDMAREIINGGL